jgi:SAM-dependent methyltransferase
LTRPLGVSAAASLLLVGVGAGGPALAVARNLGAWVTGVEVDPSLLAAARGLVSSASLGRKIAIRSWMPEVPLFEVRGHHHCLALHPFQGAAPEPILDAMAKALKPGGQLTIADLAAAAPLNVNDPVVRRWGQLERRDPAGVPLAANVGRMMGRIDLDVRIAEDISVRHSDQAMLGWRVMMRELGKPNRADAARLVAEAEMWLLRRRLIREGRLRMMRWHAMGPVRG